MYIYIYIYIYIVITHTQYLRQVITASARSSKPSGAAAGAAQQAGARPAWALVIATIIIIITII